MEVTMMSYRLASVLLRAVLLVLALAIGVGAMAGETIVGEVIDQGCFLRQEARGADHQECAARCLRNGNPAGVLTDEGEVYTLATSAAASMQVWENESSVEVPLTKFGSPEKE